MISRLLSRFVASSRGNVTLIAAVAAVPLAAAGGAALDLGRASDLRSHVQDEADAAALAGARQLISGGDIESAKATALNYIAANAGGTPMTATVTTADAATGRLGLSVTAQSPNMVLGAAGMPSTAVSASANAQATLDTPVCVLALNGSAAPGFSATGAAGLQAKKCSVWINSSAPAALSLTGAASLAADKVCVHGGVSAKKAGSVAPSAEDCGVRPDPFASLPVVTPSGCDFNNFGLKGSATLSPGVYCGGISLSGKASATLKPGVYVIRDGALSLSGGSSMNGQGVTFVLEGEASVDFSGASGVQLAGPVSGTLTGILFFQRPDANPGATAKFTGGSGIAFNGVLYFPTQTIELTGNSAATGSLACSSFIADHIRMTGSSSVSLGCDHPAVPPPPVLMGPPGSVILLQ